ncbi:class I SAM-dependent methyltransferase [Paenibacillus planticolens]|uniref:class I SAM-dependent methyltransferase n=1 Tax=Paenibacillus planticolens TaxID=2654976 RepID=UPI0014910EF6|nr:class I SAM-dependent methyltransferase [Paenibacillus planticolens]
MNDKNKELMAKQSEQSQEKSIIYWNDFYKKILIQNESSFCSFIKKKINNNSIILDVGCGSGRDTFSFGRDGYDVIGIDRSEEAIKANNLSRKNQLYKNYNIEFNVIDVSNKETLSKFMILLRNRAISNEKTIVIYVRFFLHSIDEIAEETFLRTISKYLNKGDYFAAEFRTIEDKERLKVFDPHYRRFITSENLLSDLERKYKFNIVSFEKGTGLSIYKDEDPFLARVVAQKK